MQFPLIEVLTYFGIFMHLPQNGDAKLIEQIDMLSMSSLSEINFCRLRVNKQTSLSFQTTRANRSKERGFPYFFFFLVHSRNFEGKKIHPSSSDANYTTLDS